MLIGARQGCVAGGAGTVEKMAVLKRLRYDFMELALTRHEIGNLGPGSAEEYVEYVERSGLPILSTSLGHFGDFAALSPEERAEILQHIRALIEFTGALGADTILLATREDSEDVAQYVGVYREELAPVADEAARAGVTLALEHVSGYKPCVLARLVQQIGHPGIRIYFDMGNCLNVGEDPLEQAHICALLTAQLHAKGGPTTPLGCMPLVAVREILESANFPGRVCLEIPAVEGDRPLAEARGLLKMAGYC